jgi:hypothetical protein
MQFKLDENLPPSAAELLRSLGHENESTWSSRRPPASCTGGWRRFAAS